MNKKRIPLIGLLFLALSLACTLSQKKSPQGGTQIILEADVPVTLEVTGAEMDAARTVVENRVRGLGFAEAVVVRDGDRRIVVNLPAGIDTERVAQTVYPTALLEFVDMSSITQAQALAYKDAGTTIVTDIYTTDIISPTQQVWHTVMTGAQVKNAAVSAQTGQYSVSFELTSAGATTFADFTAQHIGSVLAIVLDKKIVSAPTINAAIPEGKGVISGNFTRDSANQLAIQLRYGALPIPLKVVEVKTIKGDN